MSLCSFAGRVAAFSLVSWPTLRGPEPEHCLWNSTGPTSGSCEKGALTDLGSLEKQGSLPAA